MSKTIKTVSGIASSSSKSSPNRTGLSKRRQIIDEFCLNTSAHGLPGIARSKNMYRRLFWTISFILFTGSLIYCIVKATLAYFERPTKMNLNIVREWPSFFPAFSFCNNSPMRADKVIESFNNYLETMNISHSHNTQEFNKLLIQYLLNFFVEKVNRNESTDPFLFSLQSMLLRCRFNGQLCSAADFISFTSPIYGICYTFNAKLKGTNTSRIYYVNEYGGSGLLELGLYVHKHQYMPYVTDAVGIVGLIHDNTQVPLIETAGFHLSPGRKHRLNYKKEVTTFLPPPFSKCNDKVSPELEKTLGSYNGADYRYSTTTCYFSCLQNYIYERCGCVHPTLWNFRYVVLKHTKNVILALLCNVTNICFVEASTTFFLFKTGMEDYCSSCTEECSIVDFTVQISSLKAPMEWEMIFIKDLVEHSMVPLATNWSTRWRRHIKGSYIDANIVYATLVVENKTQVPTLGVVDVLSNIGGQMSLWIGISLLSIMEVIEMLYRLLHYQYNAIQLKRRNKNRIASR